MNGGNKIKLYYERLRGQYPDVSPPYAKVNIEDTAKVYISTFLKEPHKMKSNAIKRIREYTSQKKVFNNQHDPAEYHYCGLLNYWLNHFIINDRLKLRSKTMDMHLLLVVNLMLEKEGKQNTTEKINFLLEEENAFNIFNKSKQHVDTQQYLFERRGFYSSPKTQNLIESINNTQLIEEEI